MKVHEVYEGGARWFVRGTTDPQVAMEFVLDEYPEAAETYVDEGYDVEPYPVVERAGLFRFNPCGRNCGDHSWHLGYASKRGHGVFEGIYLDVGFRELTYECDGEMIA